MWHWQPTHVIQLDRFVVINLARIKKRPNIIILRWAEYTIGLDSDMTAQYFQKRGCKTIVVDPRNVKYDGKCLNYKGFKSNLVLKWFVRDNS